MDDERPARGGEPPQRVKTVNCSCGYVASAETGEELLAAVEAHIAAAHAPDVGEPQAEAEAAGAAALETREER